MLKPWQTAEESRREVSRGNSGSFLPSVAPSLTRNGGPRSASWLTTERANFCDVGPHTEFSECGNPCCLSFALSLSPCFLEAPSGVGAERGNIASLFSQTFQTEKRDIISSTEALLGSRGEDRHTPMEAEQRGLRNMNKCRVKGPNLCAFLSLLTQHGVSQSPSNFTWIPSERSLAPRVPFPNTRVTLLPSRIGWVRSL